MALIMNAGKKYEPTFQIVSAVANTGSITIPANSGKKFLILITRGDAINIQSVSNMTYTVASANPSPAATSVVCEVTDPTATSSLTLAGAYANLTAMNID